MDSHSTSAISILHKIRKATDARRKLHNEVTIFFLGLLILSFSISMYAYYKSAISISLFGALGVILAFAWLLYSIKLSIDAKQDLDNIDEFYLEMEYERR